MVLSGYAAGRVVPLGLSLACLVPLLGASVWWHVRGYLRFPGDRNGMQASMRLGRAGFRGALYFGILLGFGFLTRIATPLWYAMPVLSSGLNLMGAVSLGIGVGLGRSWPPAQAVWDAGEDPGGVAARGLKLATPNRTADFGRAVAAVAIIGAVLAIPHL
jgi:hypothetical protein